MKMTLKERIAKSKEFLFYSDFHNCMHRNDMDVVFYASSMVGSQLDRRHNDILMNRNAVPIRWYSNPHLSDCKINRAYKKAYAQVVEYLEKDYNITPGRILKLLDIFISLQVENSKVIKDLSNKNNLNRYLSNLNNLRMHCKEMTHSEIYDFSFDMMYDFIEKFSLSPETLSLSFLIMYWIQRESDLIPVALSCDKDTFLTLFDSQSEDIRIKRERKKKFRHFMRKVLDLHLRVLIKKETKHSKKSVSRDRILNLIKDNPNHTAKTMASCLRLSVQAVQKQIAILKSEKRLTRIGPDNGGYWKVEKSNILSDSH